MNLEIKKNRDNYEVNVFDKGSHTYRNILTRDPNRLAQVLLDLHFMGFQITEAIRIMKKRLKNKDWLGF